MRAISLAITKAYYNDLEWTIGEKWVERIITEALTLLKTWEEEKKRLEAKDAADLSGSQSGQ